jgi:hypothetical protein
MHKNNSIEVDMAEESYQLHDIEMECANQADFGYS